MAKFFRAFPTPGALASAPAPTTQERYAFVQSLAAMFVWSDSSTLDGDNVNVIDPTSAGAGRWLRVSASDAGTDLGDASVTLDASDGRWLTIPAATLGANRTLTLSATNARAGELLEITRLDVGAYTVAILNGGPGAGTLVTLPVSVRSCAAFMFDGTNWRLRRSALML